MMVDDSKSDKKTANSSDITNDKIDGSIKKIIVDKIDKNVKNCNESEHNIEKK